MPKTNVIEYRKTDDKTIVKEKLPINEEKKKNMFKGTIAISIVYGVFALVLLVATAFNDTMRDIVFIKFLPFTLIFIIGTILIIMLMLYFIFSYVPVNVPVIDNDDNYSCPDYWKVEIVNDEIIKKSFDPNYSKNLFKYKCIMNDNIYDKKQLFINTSNVDGTGLRYTNILSNITQYSMYDSTKDADFNNEYNNYSNLAKIYKNLNKYNVANYSNIKSYINTNSDTIASNIYKNLEEVAYIQNNYKFNETDKTTLSDLYYTSNVYTPSSSILSPIVWNYSDLSSPSRINTASSDISNYDSIILDWQKLTPERAYNLASRGAIDFDKIYSSNVNLYVYYNPVSASIGVHNVYLGSILIEYDMKKEPKFNMTYITKGSLQYTGSTTLPAFTSNILKRTASNKNITITYEEISLSTLSTTTISADKIVGSRLNDNEYPIIQIYNKNAMRPNTITRNTARTLNCNIPLICDEIYPSLLASYDNDNGNNNVRCAYSKICGIPWSDLRCDQSQT